MKDWTIHNIEDLTENNILLGVEDGEPVDLLENLNIKGHNVYIVDFGGYFGLSCLVFKNGRHIKYANDYQLHYSGMDKQELRKYYLDRLKETLFTEDELCEDIHSYREYRNKFSYLRDHWIMQFDRLSIFRINQELTDEERAAYPYLCGVGFSYVTDKAICERADYLFNQIASAYKKFMDDDEAFRSAIKYELSNHEAGITCDYREALGALGMNFKELSAKRQKIVNDELWREIKRLEDM